MSDLTRSLSITPPVAGKNLWVLASSASTQKLKLPNSWYRSYLTLQADGVDFWVVFSASSSADVASNAATTVASEEFTTFEGSEGYKIASGTSENFDLGMLLWEFEDSKEVYMAVIASATGGYLRILRSSGVVRPTP